MIFTAGLFFTLFILAYIFLSPGKYAVSPARLVVERMRSEIQSRFMSGEKVKMYDILNKTPMEVMKTGYIIGGALGFLTLFLMFKSSGLLALPVSLLVFLAGLFIVKLVFQNEYRRWQASLFDGIPVLTDFMPSFLETGAITPREAMHLTIPFLPEPLRSEMWKVVDYITRTGGVRQALDEFARRADHSVVYAVCFRFSSAWDAKVTPDIFADLNDQIRDMTEIAAAKASAAKGGLLALVCVIGLLGAGLIFGYPGMKYLFSTMGGVFGQ